MNWTREPLLDAQRRVAPRIHRTPVLTSRAINETCGSTLFFKCENFQTTGSFKARGATNALACLLEERQVPGVCTHSSGNFAAALAWSAKQHGLPASIVMPRNAPRVKMEAVRAYGARIVECEPTLADRQRSLEELVASTGFAPLHPYDHPWTIAGQATCAMELLEDHPGLDWLVSPVGGGGLVSGTALAAHFFSPATKVIGAEPAGADDAFQSLRQGQIIPQTEPRTMADGLLTSLGQHTFPVLRDFVDRIVLVSEEEIVNAMRLIFTRMKIVIEPSSAVTLAAVLKSPDLITGTRTGVILSGGNVDPERLPFASVPGTL